MKTYREISKIIDTACWIAFWVSALMFCFVLGFWLGYDEVKQKVLYRQTHQTITPVRSAYDPYGTKAFGQGIPDGWIEARLDQ